MITLNDNQVEEILESLHSLNVEFNYLYNFGAIKNGTYSRLNNLTFNIKKVVTNDSTLHGNAQESGSNPSEKESGLHNG